MLSILITGKSRLTVPRSGEAVSDGDSIFRGIHEKSNVTNGRPIITGKADTPLSPLVDFALLTIMT